MTRPLRYLGIAGMLMAAALAPAEPALGQPSDGPDARERGAEATPDERVRDAQRTLRTQGYYDGPLDGLVTLQLRRAIWSFQHDRGLLRTSRLDEATMALLQPGTGTAIGEAPEAFGATLLQAP